MPGERGRRTTKRAGLATLALAAGLLAGCSGQAPGTAAVVDGRSITEREVAAVSMELSPYLSQPLTPPAALSAIIQASVVTDVAFENGVGVSDDDALSTLAAISEQAGVEPPEEFADSTVLVARSLVVQQSLAQQPDGPALQAEIFEQVSQTDVTISPRYGAWDTSGTIVMPTYDWLEVSAPEGM